VVSDGVETGWCNGEAFSDFGGRLELKGWIRVAERSDERAAMRGRRRRSIGGSVVMGGEDKSQIAAESRRARFSQPCSKMRLFRPAGTKASAYGFLRNSWVVTGA
jgi:hypothetical protein